VFAMIGTIFLWICWPSFNAAMAADDERYRAVINTYLSLAACVLTTCAFSSLLSRENKMDMVHIQNATLAGGVAIGTLADMYIHPYAAVLVGTVAGIVSVFGYRYIQPFLASKLKLHDTCGVHNLHGLPGVIAGIGGAVAAVCATYGTYGISLYQVFPARIPTDLSAESAEIKQAFKDPGDGRSAGMQAVFQLAALAVTLIIALVGGIITGFILRLPIWAQPNEHEAFDDAPYWSIPSQGIPDYEPLPCRDPEHGDEEKEKLELKHSP